MKGSEPKFTKGPWVTHNDCIFGEPSEHNKDGMIAAVRYLGNDKERLKEATANANLMTTAPKMYAQLIKMRDSMNCVCRLNAVMEQLGCGIECTVCEINSILAKIER